MLQTLVLALGLAVAPGANSQEDVNPAPAALADPACVAAQADANEVHHATGERVVELGSIERRHTRLQQVRAALYGEISKAMAPVASRSAVAARRDLLVRLTKRLVAADAAAAALEVELKQALAAAGPAASQPAQTTSM